MITKCQCQVCAGSFEFDDAGFERSGESADMVFGQQAICPHCQRPTVLYKDKRPATPPPTPKQVETTVALKVEPAKPNPILLEILAALLFICGCGLVLDGCSGALHESTLAEGSAIRQIVNVSSYGFGFVMMLLSGILAAACQIARK